MPQPVRLSSAGMRDLLTSAGVQREMERVADRVRQRAEGRGVRVDGDPGEQPVPIVVREAKGRTRARALVVIDHPAGEAVESKHRLLGGALG